MLHRSKSLLNKESDWTMNKPPLHRRLAATTVSSLILFLQLSGSTLPKARAATSDKEYRVIIDAPTVDSKRKVLYEEGGVQTITAPHFAPGGKISIILRNMNGLLYEVKVEKAIIEPSDWMKVQGSNPFNPLAPTKSPAAIQFDPHKAGLTLLAFDNLDQEMIRQMVEIEKQFRQSSDRRYPDVAARVTPYVEDLITARVGNEPAQPGQVIAENSIIVAGSSFYSAMDAEQWKTIIDAFSDDKTQQNRLVALRGNKDTYIRDLSRGAKIYEDIRTLKTNQAGELEYEHAEVFDIPENKKLTLTVSVVPREGLEGAPIPKDELGKMPAKDVVVADNLPTGRGAYFSAFINSLKDKSYVVRSETVTNPDGTTSKVSRIRQAGSTNDGTVSIGTLYHFGGSGSWAPSIGVSTNGQQLDYHLGLSYKLNKQGNGLVTGGLTFGQVKGLDGVAEGDTTTLSTVPTRSVYRLGVFIGLSLGGF